MRLATTTDGQTGRIDGDRFVPLPGGLLDHLTAGAAGPDPGGADSTVALDQVELGPPLRPRSIICVGLNYRDHAAEAGMDLPAAPLLFAKLPSAVVGPGDTVAIPSTEAQVDFEAELAVVIGRTARHVPVERALEHVGGYVCFNDVSDRAAQFADGQWLRGKSFDTFAPIGPIVVTADEIGDPQALAISCTVNGEVRQRSSTAEMVFGVAELVAYCSTAFTLAPGDVIATGTPAGVGMADGRWLAAGDVMTVEIEGLGSLTNPVG